MAGVDARQTAAAWFEEYRAERDRADRAEATVAAMRTGIEKLIADLADGPLDDCCYGGGCVASEIQHRRLPALLDAAPKETS